MQKQKNSIIYFMIPLLVLMFGIVLFCSMRNTPRTDVKGNDSVWDLQEKPFEDQRYYIAGPVEYIPNALLTPEEFVEREDEAVIGQPENVVQYCTSRVRILFPDDNYYAFARRSVDYAHKMYANGILVSQTGIPGDSRETMTPETSRVTIMLKPENGVIELIQQSSIFVHEGGDEHAAWTITAGENLRSELRWDFFDALYMGSFLMLFFVHLILFLLLRSYRANLFFALFCIMGFLKTGITGAKLLTDLAPWLLWEVKFRMGYLIILLIVMFLISLAHETFPNVLQKWFRMALYGWTLLLVLLCLTVNTVIISGTMRYCQQVYLLAFAYIFVRFALKQRSLNPEQGIFLFGIVIFLSTMAYDIFCYMTLRGGFSSDLSQLAMLLLALCEAAAMFIATVRKIEEAKAEEERLVVENAALDRVNRMRSSMMATMGHEMRTPLTVMSVYAQLATENLQALSADEQTTADLKMISREAKRLSEMATGLLTMNQEQEANSRFEFIDLVALVQQMAGLCQSMLDRKNNRLVLQLNDDLPNLYANPGECTQLLWNLLSNAARHTRDGMVTICATCKQDVICLTVTDNGEGIAPELLPNIFESGVSGSEKHSGLGLALCKEIVNVHKGSIRIESPSEGGTVVTVMLPIRKEEDVYE